MNDPRITRNSRETVFTILAVACLLALLLSGCGKNTGTASEEPGPPAPAASSSRTAEESAVKETVTDISFLEETVSPVIPENPETETRSPEEIISKSPYEDAKKDALSVLSSRKSKEREYVYVYKDFGLTENHFTQKARMAGSDYELVMDMDENWQDDPYSGSSCIRCEQLTREGDWGGWLFLNGYLPEGESVPYLNDGSKEGQGLDK